MIKLSEFERIQTLSNRSFNLDAFSLPSGSNALCADFCSPRRSFFATPLQGKHIWINAPFHMLHSVIEHYLSEKSKSPSDTSACILVPKWAHSWRPLLIGMKKLMDYPCGYPLFESPPSDGAPAKALHGIPFEVEVWYDPPSPPIRMKAVTGSDCSMFFHGKANGIPVHLALDSMASRCFISKQFILNHPNLRCTPTHCEVELGDASTATISHQCMVRVSLTGANGEVCHQQVRCLVLDLGSDIDIILGEDWLSASKALMSFADKSCTVHTPKGALTLLAVPSRRPIQLLNKIQLKRIFTRRSDARVKCFMVMVSDSALSESGGGEDDEHPLDPDTKPLELPAHISPGIRRILEKHSSVFKKDWKLVERSVDHCIEMIPGSKPTYRAPYRLSPREIKEVEKQVSELLLQGLIEPSNSPYGAPILFVNKPDGSLRMCIDYRLLNAQTVKQRYPLPRIDQLIDQLHGARYMSSLDLQQGYYQIKIAPEDVPKTAFITPFGQYQFKVLSMGLCNAPSTFQALMNSIFGSMKGFCSVYLDDVIIFSKTREEHEAHLERVFQALEENQLYVKLSKCKFELTELKFLGHIVGNNGVKVDPQKTKVVHEWPTPTNVSQVRSFCGLANYFRKFLQGYSTLVAPLTALTRDGVVWGTNTWTPACQKAFDGVKKALTEAPTLAMPDFDNPMEIEVICDASTHGIGAVLTQGGRPIAYESRKLTPTEKNWTTSDQELWAVIHALKTWRCYLEGLSFTVVTDHNPLIHLQTQPSLSRRQARWAEYLSRFDFQWQYRPGRTNVADPLSRVPAISPTDFLKKISVRSDLPPPPPLPELGKRQRIPNRRYLDPPDPAPRDPSPHTAPPVIPAPATSPHVKKKRGRPRKSAKIDTLPPPPAPEARAEATIPEGLDHITGIQQGYATDPWFADPTNLTALHTKDGLWYKGNQIVVPNIPWVRKSILYELHDAPYSGHVGVRKTLEALSQLFWWPKMRQSVKSYIKACEACQRNKATNQKPAGLLNPLPIPSEPWESVGMDFITGLPRTKSGHDAILVFVDRLTKMVHLAPTVTTIDSLGTARLYVDYVWKHHGVPLDVVSDRGSVFTGTFFTELLRLIGTKHKKSSAYHPQTDGQTERVNHVLEDMLRHYVMVAGDQQEWDQYLAAAEFAINNSFHESIGTTPFRLNNGRAPRLPLSVPGRSLVPTAAQFADQMSTGLTEAKKCLEAAQQRQKRYADRSRRDASFDLGSQVLLSTSHLKLRDSKDTSTTAKLLPRWVGPFTVIEKIGRAAYKLKLPEGWRVHPVFHVSLMKPYQTDGRVQPPLPNLIDGEVFFLIDRILDHRVVKKGRKASHEYLIRWLGYGPEHDSWISSANAAESESGKTVSDYWHSLGLESPPN